jgi:predicted extracellular nuclease
MPITRTPQLAIRQIQGAGERSPHTGHEVTTRGVVTQVDRDGFWLQDAKGAPKASSAIYVHAPDDVGRVSVGDDVSVTAKVREDEGYRAPAHSLTETQLADVQQLQVLGRGQRLPEAVTLPSVSSPDEMRSRWEQFEGMRVTLGEAEVLGPKRYGYLHLRTAQDVLPVEVSTRDASDVTPTKPGDKLESVTGVLRYRGGLFQIEAQAVGEVLAAAPAQQKATTKLRGDDRHVTVASYNLENLDPKYESAARYGGHRPDDDVGSGKFLRIAQDIVDGLGTPDVLAVQEMQDADGSEHTDETSAQATADTLINHIVALGGPRYVYVEHAPDNRADGGQPGGNIRVGYFYNPERVKLREDSLARVGDDADAFAGSRKSLHACFELPNPDGGEPNLLRLYNNHFSSKYGSSALVGEVPEVDYSKDARYAQAAHVAGLAAKDADAHPGDVVVSLGDFNDFKDTGVVTAFEQQGFTHFADGQTDDEAYSHYFRGHRGLIDHALVKNVKGGGLEGEVVHRNALFEDRASDHDPVILRLRVYDDE